MAQEARQSLSSAHPGINIGVLDAQAIPFAAARFDAVIANHMLYHVPDRAKAFSEIRRVLKPEGRFFAATNGPAHMRELRDRARAAATHAGALADSWVEAFNLENGQEELSPWFPRVLLHRYEDALVVTEAEPLVAYVLSGRYGQLLAGEALAAFCRAMEAEIAQRGSLRITKDTGLFEARQQADR
jgi:SAM-dependent methyltransferase